MKSGHLSSAFQAFCNNAKRDTEGLQPEADGAVAINGHSIYLVQATNGIPDASTMCSNFTGAHLIIISVSGNNANSQVNIFPQVNKKTGKYNNILLSSPATSIRLTLDESYEHETTIV